jgi:hypothetical protein
MFHGKQFGCAACLLLRERVGGAAFFQRCVGVVCVEAEDENMRRHVRKGMAAGN